jgi:glycine cleavage system H protein
MVEVPANLMYTKTHEWARIEGNRITIGITDHAQHELTDIVYVELPEIGRDVETGGEIAVVESVKSTSDFYSPVTGKVVEINSELENSPDLMNAEPYGRGWLAIIECTNVDTSGLLSPDAYKGELG